MGGNGFRDDRCAARGALIRGNQPTSLPPLRAFRPRCSAAPPLPRPLRRRNSELSAAPAAGGRHFPALCASVPGAPPRRLSPPLMTSLMLRTLALLWIFLSSCTPRTSPRVGTTVTGPEAGRAVARLLGLPGEPRGAVVYYELPNPTQLHYVACFRVPMSEGDLSSIADETTAAQFRCALETPPLWLSKAIESHSGPFLRGRADREVDLVFKSPTLVGCTEAVVSRTGWPFGALP